MDSFSILVDLSSFFSDFRSKSLVYVNTGSMKTVASVENHIKKLFGIESKTYVLSQNNYVPGGEDSRILKHLLSIRLAAESPSKERRKATKNETTVEENGNSDKVSKKKRKLEEIPTVDTDETLDTGRSSKKKIKKRQSDYHNVNGDHSSPSPSIPVGHSATPEQLNGPGTVKKSKEQQPANNCDSDSIQKKNKNQAPNKAFYGYQCEEPSVSSQAMESKEKDTESIVSSICTEHSVAKNTTDGCETLSDKDGFDGTNTDNASHIPKRKRIRKRKRANKEDIPDKLAETTAPKIVNPFLSNKTTVPKMVNPFAVNSKLPKANSKHIFFPEEVEGPLQPSEEISENETTNAEGPGTEEESTVTDCPVDNKGPEETRSEAVNSDLPSGRLPVSAQQDHVENSSTEDLPSAGIPIGNSLPKPKPNTGGRSCGGLGKLLSLMRTENPPVFERKKIPKNTQATTPNREEDSSRSSTPTSKQSCSPVRFPTESVEASTIGAPLDSVPAIGAEIALTPLKTLPEINMKISFQILKMSESYCPELSKPIVAIVKELDAGTQDLSLKILSGEEECQTPTGKFSLEEEAEKTHIEEIILNFADLIEPKVFP